MHWFKIISHHKLFATHSTLKLIYNQHQVIINRRDVGTWQQIPHKKYLVFLISQERTEMASFEC